MAASDYEIRTQGPLTLSALVVGNVSPSQATITLSNISGPGAVVPGMWGILGNEIVHVATIELPTITLNRGCADTIPAAHAAGTRIWLMTNGLPRDTREYTATDTIGVKGLNFTPSGGNVPIAGAEPMSVTFNWRQIRPYPPGDVRVDGVSCFAKNEHAFEPGIDDLVLTWTHRDRLLQADQLIGHGFTNIGPEPGTTYRVEVYDHTETLVRTVSAISGNSYTYTRANGLTDLSEGAGHFRLCSVRDGYDSLQSYRINFRLTAGGLGLTLGQYLGEGI